MTFLCSVIKHCVPSISPNTFITHLALSAVASWYHCMVWRFVRYDKNPNCIFVLDQTLRSVINIFSRHLFFFFCFLYCLASVVAFYSSSKLDAWRIELFNSQTFLMSQDCHQNVNYQDYLLVVMRGSTAALTKCDRNCITRVSSFDAWVNW